MDRVARASRPWLACDEDSRVAWPRAADHDAAGGLPAQRRQLQLDLLKLATYS
jgi:hypothetical protein